MILASTALTGCGNQIQYKDNLDSYCTTMQYRDGFTIVQLTDIHWSSGTDAIGSKEYLSNLISKLKEAYGTIDLIELTGDQFMLSNARTAKEFIKFMESLDKICSIENTEWCIPSHGDFLQRNIEETAELNKIAIISTRMCILDSLKDFKPHTPEDIIKYVADKNNLEMTLSQYALISSTVKSYLAVMHDAREIKIKVEKNKLYFYRENKE